MNTDVIKLLNNMLLSIEYEREEERERHIDEIKNLSAAQRENKGRALIDLKKKRLTRTLTGDILYMFRKKDRKLFPNLEFAVGDELVISQYDPLDNANPTGIVYELGADYIVIATTINIEATGVRPFRLDLFVSDLTYGRMTDAVMLAKSNQGSNIRTILSGEYFPSTSDSFSKDENLNEMQYKAATYAFNCNGFYTIQGPPGTGKTYMISFLISDLVKSGKKVLISADSNAAVDNLINKCLDRGLTPLRIGHPIRVNDDLKKYTLDYAVLRHSRFKEVLAIETEIECLKHKLKEKEKPTKDKLRGYSYSEVMELIASGHSGRGISKRTLHSMKPYAKIKVKIDKLYEDIKKLRVEIVKELIESNPIIAATNSTCGSDLLSHTRFDFSVVDEASQASLPSTLIPIQKADRFVLVGDHHQLPPVVISEKAIELGLDYSLMDRLVNLYPYQMTMLERQYRMNDRIMNLVSSMFYDGRLISDESVRDRKLELGDASKLDEIDVIEVVGREQINADSKSYYNLKEREVLLSVLQTYIDAGVSVSDIGVITPYRAQVKSLREVIDGVEVDTVDAFQGREKDLIIVSFVRSNDNANIGFLSDVRRLNVTISRAKKKLILIGNIKMLKTNSVYRELFERVENDI